MYFLYLYMTIAISVYCNVLFAIYSLNSIKTVANAKERSKIIKKIDKLISLKIYCLIWPYVVIKIKNLQ
jgi:hypothetical protein